MQPHQPSPDPTQFLPALQAASSYLLNFRRYTLANRTASIRPNPLNKATIVFQLPRETEDSG